MLQNRHYEKLAEKRRDIIKVTIISIEIHRRCQKPNGKAMVPICIARIV